MIRIDNIDFTQPMPKSLTVADLEELSYQAPEDQVKIFAIMEAEDFSFDTALNLIDYYGFHKDADLDSILTSLGNTAQGDPHHSMDAFMAQKTLAEYLAGQLAFVQTSYGVVEMEV